MLDDMVMAVQGLAGVMSAAFGAVSAPVGYVVVETVTGHEFDDRNNRVSRTVTGRETYTVTYTYDLNPLKTPNRHKNQYKSIQN